MKKLGFGCMRFPLKSGYADIDVDQVKKCSVTIDVKDVHTCKDIPPSSSCY